MTNRVARRSWVKEPEIATAKILQCTYEIQAISVTAELIFLVKTWGTEVKNQYH
jgi:hypothetical protein